MKIYNVVGKANGNYSRNITFNRKLKESEKKDYTKTITDTMDYLGVQNRALIIHGSSFPADSKKDIEQKIGSPYNAKKFLDFAKLHGFNAIQLGPTGRLNKGDTSPYSSSVFAKNPLFIDLSLLTTSKYASILSQDELYAGTYEVEIPDENYTRTDYKEAQEISDSLLDKAYENFKQKLMDKDPDTLKLYKEFDKFQKENSRWLEYYSVLSVISDKYGTDYYPHWSEEDANLIPDFIDGDHSALMRYLQIRHDNPDKIENYKFKQFLIDKQSREDNKKRKDVVYISDLLVGSSSFDEIIYSNVFKKGYKIGAKDGGTFNSPQLWDIPMLDPDKLFRPNGALGPAGEFLKMKIKKALTDATNVRVDHAMGLVDPFVYKPESVVYGKRKNDAGETVEYPLREKLQGGYLSQLGIDKNKNYQRIIPEIVLPTMRELGLDPKQVVWEDLGNDETGVFNKIFRKQLNLPGINVLLWDRGENSKPNNWAYVGCHDNPPVNQSVEKKEVQNKDAWNLDYLAGYLNPSSERTKERAQFKQKIANNPKELIKAKWADLFRSTKNIQISFMDFFGINKQYNTPGTSNNENWTLRLNPNYEDTYHKSLSSNGYAINMPEVLTIALQAKSDMDIVRGEKTKTQSQREIKPLMDKLNHYSEILKEKE